MTAQPIYGPADTRPHESYHTHLPLSGKEQGAVEGSLQLPPGKDSDRFEQIRVAEIRGLSVKVSLFVTCLVDQLFPQVGLAAVKVLEKAGATVEFDRRQTCCGQPAFNSGYWDEAARVGRRILDLYDGKDPVVVPSGSCATMIKVFLPRLFSQGSVERRRIEEIGRLTYEFSDFLVSVLGVRSTGARFAETVTFHDSCHQLRELGIAAQPRLLIREVEGLNLVEMDRSQRCCGFGGTFSVKFPDVSSAIGRDKVRAIEESGARYIVGTDVSCLMHIGGLLRRQGVAIETMHLAELLAKF